MNAVRFNSGAWEWPDTLAPLMQWAEGRGMDVYSFKSERQAFFMIKDVAKQKVKFPKHGQSCFPHLVKLQRTLCPSGMVKPEPTTRDAKTEKPKPGAVSRVYGLGTFGAADDGRRVSVEEYMLSSGCAK